MTDKQRQAFEAYALDRGLSLARINSIDDIYDSDQTAEAWEAWTASRKLALEEAAQIVDGVCPAAWQIDLRKALAAAIRQQQEPTPQHPLQVAGQQQEEGK